MRLKKINALMEGNSGGTLLPTPAMSIDFGSGTLLDRISNQLPISYTRATVATVTVTLPTVVTMYIGNFGAGGAICNCHIKRLDYYNRRLGDTQTQVASR